MIRKKLIERIMVFSLSAIMVFTAGSSVYANVKKLPSEVIVSQDEKKSIPGFKEENNEVSDEMKEEVTEESVIQENTDKLKKIEMEETDEEKRLKRSVETAVATPSEAFYTPENPRIELDEAGEMTTVWDTPEEEQNAKCILIEISNKNGIVSFQSTDEESLSEKEGFINLAASMGRAVLNEEGDILNFRVIYSLNEKYTYDDINAIPEEEWAYSENFVYVPNGVMVSEIDRKRIKFNADGSVTYQKVNGENIIGYHYLLYKRGIGSLDDVKPVVQGIRWQDSGGEENLYWLKNYYVPGYEYQIKFRTLANLNNARNSHLVESDWWNPSDGKNDIIDELLNKNGEEFKKAVEEKKLTKEELDKMRTDLIASNEVTEKYKELEKKFMTIAGVEIPNLEVESGIVDKEKINIFGAGMNKISNIEFKKTKTPDNLPSSIKKNAIALDISAFVGANDQAELKYPILITMPVPQGMEATGLSIYHYLKNGQAEWIYPRNNEDGTVTFAITHFSTFIFNPKNEDEPEKPDDGGGDNIGGSGNSGSSDSSNNNQVRPNGTWRENNVGWWFVKNDGTHLTNSWYMCYWRGEMNWYHFNVEGYLDMGWFKDNDGQTYFLHNLHDNNFGYMYTGWKWIDGKCFYFISNKTSDGLPVGALFKNGLTPDGFTVNENGEWVKDGIIQTIK